MKGYRICSNPLPQKCQLYPDIITTIEHSFFQLSSLPETITISSPRYAVNPFLVVTNLRNSLFKNGCGREGKEISSKTSTLNIQPRFSIKKFLADSEIQTREIYLEWKNRREMVHLSKTSNSMVSNGPLRSAKLRLSLSKF